MKKIITGFILGILITGTIGVLAANTISSSIVTYNNKTVEKSLDELYDEAVTGKSLIATAITNKGVTTSNTATYQTMATNISNIEPSLKVATFFETYTVTKGQTRAVLVTLENLKMEKTDKIVAYFASNLSDNSSIHQVSNGGWIDGVGLYIYVSNSSTQADIPVHVFAFYY